MTRPFTHYRTKLVQGADVADVQDVGGTCDAPIAGTGRCAMVHVHGGLNAGVLSSAEGALDAP